MACVDKPVDFIVCGLREPSGFQINQKPATRIEILFQWITPCKKHVVWVSH
jgi:hypothetical protein